MLQAIQKIRVYRPEEAPEKAREKACARESACTEPEWIAEGVFGTCNETGIQGELFAKGVTLHRAKGDGPFWSLYPAAVTLKLEVSDRPKFFGWLASEGKLTRSELRRLLYVDREGGVAMSSRRQRGHGEGTVAEFDTSSVEFPTKEIRDALASLEGLWEDFVRDTAHEAGKRLEAEYEHASSWETIAERLRDMGEGIDDDGNTWLLSECEEVSDESEGEE